MRFVVDICPKAEVLISQACWTSGPSYSINRAVLPNEELIVRSTANRQQIDSSPHFLKLYSPFLQQTLQFAPFLPTVKMKFGATLVTFGLAIGAAFAEPIPKFSKRALQDYLDVISGINTQVNLVESLFAGYTGGDGTPVLNAGNDLVDLINQGTTDVGTFAPLNTADGLLLVQPIIDLTDDVNAAIDTTIAKESVVDANGYHQDVYDNLVAQKAASEALADAISAKVPADLQDLADQLSAEIAAAIQRGIDAYA